MYGDLVSRKEGGVDCGYLSVTMTDSLGFVVVVEVL